MKKSVFLIVGLSIMMSSCVYSLFPIYTDDTLVFKKELIGSWQSGETTITFLPSSMVNEISVSFEPDDYMIYKGDTIRDKQRMEDAITSELQGILNKNQKGYKMTISEGEKSFSYLVHLVEINDEIFMDLYPWTEGLFEKDVPTPLASNALLVHTFYKMEVDREHFKMIDFNLPMLRNMFKKNMIRLRHELLEDEVLITAQPKEIQKFIEKYATNPEVFESTNTYRRL